MLSNDQDYGEGVRRDAIEVDLAHMPPTVEQIVLAASTDGGSALTFGEATSVRMWVANADSPDAPAVTYEIHDLADERALIFGEIYRRDDGWKVRAVGQGYRDGLAALVADFGVEVDQTPPTGADRLDAGASPDAEASPSESEGSDRPPFREERLGVANDPTEGAASATTAKVAMTRRRRPSRLAADWRERTSPYLPFSAVQPWQRARMFPSVGIKTAAEQEVRATSVVLSVTEIVREFGRSILSQLGGPAGRIETFTEVRFTHAGKDMRPDGLIRVSRGSRVWHALVEVKTGAARLDSAQVGSHLAIAKAKGYDAVVTISGELMAASDENAVVVDTRKYKNVMLRNLSWEEIIAEAAIVDSHNGIDDRTRARVMDEFLRYACEPQAGMTTFNDMGTHWVKVREAVKVRTIGANDVGTVEVCRKFDQLTRHIALQLSALTGQRVTSVVPANHPDAVGRAKQLADSGGLFGSLRVAGAAGLVVLNANLGTERIGCSLSTFAPRSGRPSSKIGWLTKQLEVAPGSIRVSAHHAGSRTESTSALLSAILDDPTAALPPNGKDIRGFTVALDASMGSKRAGSEGGFVAGMVKLSNKFYVEVVEKLRNGRDT